MKVLRRCYVHNEKTRLEAAIARWGTPQKAEEQTGLPYDKLWDAWLRIEEADRHPFLPGEADGLYCQNCQLPRRNRRHNPVEAA